MAEKVEEKVIKKPSGIQKWYKETIGELRKVSWPTPQEAWRLTTIVIITMVATSLGLWLLDLLFSFLVKSLVAL